VSICEVGADDLSIWIDAHYAVRERSIRQMPASGVLHPTAPFGLRSISVLRQNLGGGLISKSGYTTSSLIVRPSASRLRYKVSCENPSRARCPAKSRLAVAGTMYRTRDDGPRSKDSICF
jgi:hypothetical protein